MNAFDRVTEALRDHGYGEVKNSKTRCPSHDDDKPSLSVRRIEGSVLLHCLAGCETADVLAALDLEMRDLYDNRKEAVYDYSDGRRVHRRPDKTFRQSGTTKGKSLYHAERIGDAESVYIPEGEKDVLAIESIGGTAVCNAMGAGKAHLFDWSPLKGKRAIIVQDKDDKGRKHAADLDTLLCDIAESVQLAEAAVGKDAADHIAAGLGLDELVTVPSPLLAGLITAAELDDMVFGKLVEHVPGLIVEGFGILAGAPKAGKSWLAVAIALACAQGGRALDGLQVQPRHVLLLALEDGNRRLQSRMWRLNGDDPLPANLHIITKVAPGDVGPTIREWLKLHRHDENPPLIILDTLGKARPQRKAGEDPYIADYQLGTWIKNTVDRVPGAALVAVHHTRKMGAADWLDTVAGTQGITGSADYVLVLTRKRKSADGLIAVTGRDVYENEYALRVDNGLWRLDGSSLDDAAEAADTRREQERLGDRALEVLGFVNGRPQTTPADVAKHLDIDNKQASVYLSRLAESGRIRKLGRGVYASALNVVSVETDENDQTDSTEKTHTTPSLDQQSPLCKHCGDFLAHPDSIARGYCAKSECSLKCDGDS